MKKLQFCLVAISMLLLALIAVAQVQNGQFTGVVTDPSGAAIANAKVTVTNIGTNSTTVATTNQSGIYLARELPVGTYTIAVEARGFRKTVNTGVPANAGVVSHLDFKMEIGQESQTVEVTGEAPAIQTDDSRLSTTIDSTQI